MTLEARAVGQVLQRPGDTTQPPQYRDVTETIASETVNINDDPLICATQAQAEGDDEAVHYIYLFWQVTLPIGRPKGRLQKLQLFLNPVASLAPLDAGTVGDSHDDYLPSQIPASVNLLQPFSQDPYLAGINLHLSASRITKAASSTPILRNPARPIKCGARRLFRAAPAFLWRIRFLRYPGLSEKKAILACFDLEITQFAGCDVSLEDSSLRLSSGTYEPVGVVLPQRCKIGEQMTLIYKILPPAAYEKGDIGSSRTLTVSLSANVLVSPECIPKVRTKWKTALELPPSRPNSRNGPVPITPLEPLSSIGHDALTMTGEVAEISNTPSISTAVSLTITAPKIIYAEEIFKWEILVVNKSDSIQRFAILPISKRRFGDLHAQARRPSSSGSHKDTYLANPVMDESVIYSTHKSGAMDSTNLICLTPDVRVGSLGPSSCFTIDIQFLAMSTGVLQIEALRLVDLNTQQTVDIRQLPDIVAVRRES